MGDLYRDELLRRIRSRMESNKIFYPDIWDRLVKSETSVLEEIEQSNFEQDVLRIEREIDGESN